MEPESLEALNETVNVASALEGEHSRTYSQQNDELSTLRNQVRVARKLTYSYINKYIYIIFSYIHTYLHTYLHTYFS